MGCKPSSARVVRKEQLAGSVPLFLSPLTVRRPCRRAGLPSFLQGSITFSEFRHILKKDGALKQRDVVVAEHEQLADLTQLRGEVFEQCKQLVVRSASDRNTDPYGRPMH